MACFRQVTNQYFKECWSSIMSPNGLTRSRWVNLADNKHLSNVKLKHYGDVMMNAMLSQITSLTIVCSNVYSGADQRKHHSSAALAFVRGIHRWPVNSPHKRPVTRKICPFDDVIMGSNSHHAHQVHISVYVSLDLYVSRLNKVYIRQ